MAQALMNGDQFVDSDGAEWEVICCVPDEVVCQRLEWRYNSDLWKWAIFIRDLSRDGIWVDKMDTSITLVEVL